MSGPGDSGERQAEQARLADRLISAEQDERRRLALFLHDGPVQSLSGIALMLDAVRHAVDEDRLDDARRILDAALERHRNTIRELRALSFNLEPVVLRDQGFSPAVRGLAEQIGLDNQIQVELDVEAGEALAERAQVAIYQIIREAMDQAVRRGPPTRISVAIEPLSDGGIVLSIADDGAGERRRRTFESIEERVRTLSGRLEANTSEDGGTVIRITLPSYVVQP